MQVILLETHHRVFLYPGQDVERTYAYFKVVEILRTAQARMFCAGYFKNLLLRLFDFPHNLQQCILSLCLSPVANSLMINASWQCCQKSIFTCISQLQEADSEFCEQLCMAALDRNTFLGKIFHVQSANAQRNPAEFFAAAAPAAAGSGAEAIESVDSPSARYITELQALLDKLQNSRSSNCTIG